MRPRRPKSVDSGPVPCYIRLCGRAGSTNAMAKESLNSTEVRDMMLAVADRIIASEPILTDADRALGDGDHGVGMERGMRAVREKLAADPPEDVGKVFMDVGMAMMSTMGGASGAVFGTLFRSGGKAISGALSFGGEQAVIFFREASQGVMQRGGAKPGDKTMVDALDPIATTIAGMEGQPLAEVLEAAAEAAEAGKEASKDLIATMGRAKTLGEKSLGKPDAGAVSVSIIVAAMRDFVRS